jgi:hypothetical protein
MHADGLSAEMNIGPARVGEAMSFASAQVRHRQLHNRELRFLSLSVAVPYAGGYVLDGVSGLCNEQ